MDGRVSKVALLHLSLTVYKKSNSVFVSLEREEKNLKFIREMKLREKKFILFL